MSQAIREAVNNWYDAIGMIFRAHWNLISQMAIQAYKSLQNSLINIPPFPHSLILYYPIPNSPFPSQLLSAHSASSLWLPRQFRCLS